MRQITPLLFFTILLGWGCSSGSTPEDSSEVKKEWIEIDHYTNYVNPLIGTDGPGNTYPGAASPFGMVQLSPDNGRPGWDWIAGYFYPDSIIAGFSHTHLSGTGAGDLYDISFFPYVGKGKRADIDGNPSTLERYSRFSHGNEVARAGYYKVILLDGPVKAEMTATERSGFQQYTFPATDSAFVELNLGYSRNWDKTVSAGVQLQGDSLLLGHRFSSGWATDQKVFYATRFTKLPEEIQLLSNGIPVDSVAAEGTNLIIKMRFKTQEGEAIGIRTGLSSVSSENAYENVWLEQKNQSFIGTVEKVRTTWEEHLSKVKIKTTDDEKLEIFYTGLYRNMLAPTLLSDQNGEYRGADGKVHTLDHGKKYTTFSLWDTYRATHPLYTLILPERVPDMINSMLSHYEQYGALTVWDLWGNETDMMTGYHSIPVIADAMIKGMGGFDREDALEAMVKTMNIGKFGLDARRQYGYIPFTVHDESVSLDLEYSYDEYAVYRAAKELSNDSIMQTFSAYAQQYDTHFDQETGFFIPKDRAGNPLSRFDPLDYSRHYTEGNAWQFLWHVQHDVPGLIQLLGGEQKFQQKLDAFFETEGNTEDLPVFISGLMGQYVHGNEPTHHVPYLYALAGNAQKTRDLVRQIMEEQYNATPNGLAGNEDCGQMSAWYVFSALGFYPVNPVGGEYVLGIPAFEEIEISLPNEKSLIIRVDGDIHSTDVQQILWNGEPVNKPVIQHEELMKGGEWVWDF